MSIDTNLHFSKKFSFTFYLAKPNNVHCASSDAVSGGISWNTISWNLENRNHLYVILLSLYQIRAYQATSNIRI